MEKGISGLILIDPNINNRCWIRSEHSYCAVANTMYPFKYLVYLLAHGIKTTRTGESVIMSFINRTSSYRLKKTNQTVVNLKRFHFELLILSSHTAH